jgi:hypothetical protein
LANYRKNKKNCWLWKWTLGADKQEHLEEKRLEMKYLEKIEVKIHFLMTFGQDN